MAKEGRLGSTPSLRTPKITRHSLVRLLPKSETDKFWEEKTLTADKRTLRVLSVLHHTPVVDGDVIDRLQPFFEPILLEQSGALFDAGAFANEIRARYGWAFSEDMAAELCPRFVRAGWLEAVVENGDQSAYRVKSFEPTSNEDSASSPEIGELADSFTAFCKSLSPLLCADLSPEEALENLSSWAANLDRYDPKSLVEEARTLKDPSTGTISLLEQTPEALDGLEADERFLCARFTQELSAKNSPLLDTLARVAELGFLVDLIEDFQKPPNLPKKVDLIVYLDSRIALSLLSVSGEKAAANSQELLAALLKAGVSVRVFQTTMNEMQTALKEVLKRPPTDRHGPTHEAIIRGETNESYATEVAKAPKHFLEQIKVKVDPMSTRPTAKQLELFSADDVDSFYSRVNWNVTKDQQRQHEADVFAQITRKRGGNTSEDILRAKYLFATDNPKFWALARRYSLEHSILGESDVPQVISVRHLALSLWLSTGFADASELSKRQLLAAAEKVLTVRKDIVADAVRRLGDLNETTREQFATLVGSPSARRVFMDATLNSRKISAPNEIEGVLQAMKDTLVADEKARSEAEKESIQKAERAKLDQAKRAERAAKARAETANEAFQGEVARQTAYHADQVDFVQQFSPWLSWLIILVAYLCALGLTALLVFQLFEGPSQGVALLVGCLITAALTTSGLFGWRLPLAVAHKAVMVRIGRAFLVLRGAETRYAALQWDDYKLHSKPTDNGSPSNEAPSQQNEAPSQQDDMFL